MLYCCHRCVGMQNTLGSGQVLTILCDDIAAVHDWLGYRLEDSSEKHILISRLPPRRLLERLDLSKVETHWLTENSADGALYPHLEKIDSKIRERIKSDDGTIIFEGLESLIGLHGWDAVMTFIRSLVDALATTSWTLLFPIDPLTIDSKNIAMLTREAPNYTLPENKEEFVPIIDSEEISPEIEIEHEHSLEVTEDGSPKLVHLVRIPRGGYSRSTLRKRIMSWRRMGLDVSEVEPALYYDDDDRSYALYSLVEEKVRLAVELDRVIDLLASTLKSSGVSPCG